MLGHLPSKIRQHYHFSFFLTLLTHLATFLLATNTTIRVDVRAKPVSNLYTLVAAARNSSTHIIQTRPSARLVLIGPQLFRANNTPEITKTCVKVTKREH